MRCYLRNSERLNKDKKDVKQMKPGRKKKICSFPDQTPQSQTRTPRKLPFTFICSLYGRDILSFPRGKTGAGI